MEIVSLILMFVLAGALVWILILYKDLIRKKNSLDEAWDYLENRLNKKCAFLEILANTSEVFMSQEENIAKNLIRAKNELIKKETPYVKAQAEAITDDIVKDLLEASNKHPDLESNRDFLKIRKQLDEIEFETRYAKRFYNTNALDFNDEFKSFPGNLMAKMLKYEKQEYFDPAASGDSHPDYRAELEKHSLEDVKMCKRRCIVCTHKKVARIGYKRTVVSIVLVVFIVAVACYAVYSLFYIAPVAKNFAAQLANKNVQPAVPSSAGSDSSNWKTFKNGVFEIKYPDTWTMVPGDNGEIDFRKYETVGNYMGTDVEIKIGEIENPQNLALAEILGGNGRTLKNGYENVEMGGKSLIKANTPVSGEKLRESSFYWQTNEGNVYYLDETLFNASDGEDEQSGKDVLDTLKILN